MKNAARNVLPQEKYVQRTGKVKLLMDERSKMKSKLIFRVSSYFQESGRRPVTPLARRSYARHFCKVVFNTIGDP